MLLTHRRPPPGPPAPTPAARPRAWRLPRGAWEWPVEAILLVVCAYWVLAANGAFFSAALAGRDADDASAWVLAGALALGLVALHAGLLALVAHRWFVRPLLALLVLTTAIAAHYVGHLGVYLDPSMLRNVLRTDYREARELFSWAMVPTLLFVGGPPLLLLSRVRPARRPWKRALLMRLAFVTLCAGMVVAVVVAFFAPLASLMRNHKEMRYLITPANVVYSMARVLGVDAKAPAGPLRKIGEDAVHVPRGGAAGRPRLVVLVVGETARTANWGLSGYTRQTTPRLAELPVINFADVTACGTNTEVSLPCMFAPVGRRDYDESRIRGSESLLHLLARAGVGVTWRDNQSGCKGVCEGLPAQSVLEIGPPGLCADGRCLDEGLLHGLPDLLREMRGTQLLVLHMLGNHGPSYFRRIPPAFAKFEPACRSDDLRRCSTTEIVNAYDNALLYTDHVLARLVEQLRAAQGLVDSAMLYVSDHGESLGESNFYLHGLPWAIAPDVQKKVPMVMWLSDGFAQRNGLDRACLRARAAQPAAHDHLFHTLLGLLDVRTALHEPAWDLGHECRTASQ